MDKEAIKSLLDKKAKEQYNKSGSFSASPFGLDGIPFVRRDAIVDFCHEILESYSTELRKENEELKKLNNGLTEVKLKMNDAAMEYVSKITQLQSTNEYLKQRCEAAIEKRDEYFEIIKQLCFLKDMKDNMGKTEQYLKQQPLAWKAAFSAIEEQQ